MSEEDSDSEARGVDALRLLKQGSIRPRTTQANTGGPSTSQPASVPLLTLLPSQKRARSLSQDLHEQSQPSASQRIQTDAAISNRQVSQRRASQEKDIKQHSSAPERCLSLAKELRNSKSVPDLTLPALAAIRGLQNGTLQVDRQTRLKIAAAAKRVLESRELKRRSSQERDPQPAYPYVYPPPDPISPLALKSQTLWDANKVAPPPPASGPSPEQRRSEGKGKNLEEGSPRGEVPGSLGTAAAIARGQSPPGTAQGNFHRPALGTVSQSGALLSTSHRPFTVTTGLPRFDPAGVGVSNEEQTLPVTPSTSLGNKAEDYPTPKLLDSKMLDAEDIFKCNKSERQ